ncbi:MAG: SDR family NAD(P)-dependent oxidoreductase, partial [Pseudomonadota bacterium]
MAQGGTVISVDRNFATPPVGQGIVVELTAPDMPDVITAACTATPGPLQGVIHCAGISATGAFADIPIPAQNQVMQVNLTAPIRLTNALITSGHITDNTRLCFVASLSCYVGYPGAAAYAGSKDGMRSYAASLHKARVARSVTTAYPGPLRTDHASRYAPDNSDAAVARRMAPDQAAQIIYTDTISGRRRSLPGMGAKLAAVAGTLAPGVMGRLMRAALFEKLTDVRI